MKEKLIFYGKNPFVLAALVLSLLMYTGLIRIPQNHSHYVPVANVSALAGTIASNAVKKSNSYYSCLFALEECDGVLEEGNVPVHASAGGKITVWIPEAFVEALYPGKLYSLAGGKGVLVEQGERLLLSGRMRGEIFIAEKVEGLEQKNNGLNFIFFVRAKLRLAFKRMMYAWENAGGLVLSLLCGSREFVQEGVGELFRKAGLSHILALSGMHLGFFTGIFTFIAKNTAGKKYASLFSFVGISLFVFIVGFTPSLVRSFLFTSTVMLLKELHLKEVRLIPVLCFVFVIHSLLFPYDVHSVSFILSYCALFGILIFSDFLNVYLVRFLPPKISSSVAASIGALGTTMPVSAAVFGEVMPVSVISSVVLSPLVSIFMALSFAGIFLCILMPFLLKPFGCIMNLLYEGIILLVKLFSFFPSIRFR